MKATTSDPVVLRDWLSAEFGHPVSLDESALGLRSTVFHVLAIAIAGKMARSDAILHDKEKDLMGRLICALELVPSEASHAVSRALSGAALGRFTEAAALREFAPHLDRTSATLLWATALEMAMADGELTGSEHTLLDAISAALPVAEDAAEILFDAKVNGTKIPASKAALLWTIHPAAALALGVGPARLAHTLLSTLDLDQGDVDPNASRQAAGPTGLHAHVARKRSFLGIYEGICSLDAFMAPAVAAEVVERARRLREGKFQLTVVGEFSRGKSTLLNALLGAPLLPRSVVPCNAGIVRLRHASQPRCLLRQGGEDVSVPFEQFKATMFSTTEQDVADRLTCTGAVRPAGIMELPHAWLADGVEVLDTPGLNENAQLELLVASEAERSDAFILVVSALQPMTRLELDALHLLGEHADKTVFLACNFVNLIPDAQRHLLRKRIEDAVSTHAGGTDVRVAFVGAEPALQYLMGNDPDARWASDVVALREQIACFLAQERGAAELRSHEEFLRKTIAHVRDRVRSCINEVRRMDAEKHSERRRLIEDRLVDQNAELARSGERRQRMTAHVRRFVDELAAQSVRAADKVLGDIANDLPSAGKRWKSTRSALVPWEVAKDFGKQVELYVTQELNARLGAELSPAIDALTRKLATELGEDAAALYAAAAGVHVDGVSIRAAREDPARAGERIVKSVVGVVLVGPAGLGAGAAPIGHMIAMFVTAVVVAAVVVVLGGGPITIGIAVAASAIAVLLLGSEGMKESVRDRLVKKVVEEMPGMHADVRTMIEGDVKHKGEQILALLTEEQGRLEGEARKRVAELEQERALSNEPGEGPDVVRFEESLVKVDGIQAELSGG